MSKYRIGDLVKIKDDLQELKLYTNRCFYSPEMYKYAGLTTKISKVLFDQEAYILEGCSHWWFTDEMFEVIDNCKKEKIEELITPQSFESNDGRFAISVSDDGHFEVVMTILTSDEDGYYDNDADWVQKLEIAEEDVSRLIDILNKSKEINPYNLSSLREKKNL